MRYWQKRNLWDNAVRLGYIYHAKSDSRIRPSKSKGDFVCVVMESYKRWWAFKSLIDRDNFVDKYGAERVFSDQETLEMNRKAAAV